MVKHNITLSIDLEVWAESKQRWSNLSNQIELLLKEALALEPQESIVENEALKSVIAVQKAQVAKLERKLKDQRKKAEEERAKAKKVKDEEMHDVEDFEDWRLRGTVHL